MKTCISHIEIFSATQTPYAVFFMVTNFPWFLYYVSAALIFGAITVVAGISGTLFGSELSKKLGQYTRKAEAIVCSLGMMLGTPFLFLALTVPQYDNLYIGWVR